jgi:tight adherence protein B
MFLLAAFLIFTAALLGAAWYAVQVPRREESEVVANRLRDLRMRSAPRRSTAGALLREESRGTFSFLSDFVSWLGVQRRLQESIDQANLKYRATDVLVVTVLVFALAYAVLGVAGLDSQFVLRLVFSGIAAAAPVAYILRVRKKRLARFEELFPDAIDLFNRSMKAGHTIHSGLETIANESLEPVRMEFKKVVEELSLGSPLEDALHHLGARVPLVDLKFYITGLILQRQTGANLTEVLENLGLLVRERLNMAKKLKAHTAQQRLSAGLLCALPVIVALGFWIVKPEYMELLYTDETGSIFLTYGVISEIVGILVIRRIANPKF